jgi:hypothetical protein
MLSSNSSSHFSSNSSCFLVFFGGGSFGGSGGGVLLFGCKGAILRMAEREDFSIGEYVLETEDGVYGEPGKEFTLRISSDIDDGFPSLFVIEWR